MNYAPNQQSKVCPGCGAMILPGTTVCGNCGRILADQSQPQQPQYQPPQQPQYQQPQYQPPQYQPPVQPVYQPPMPAPGPNVPVGEHVTKGEFRRRFASKSFYKELNIVCIITYVLLAINLASTIALSAYLGEADPLGIGIIVVLLALTVGVHVTKSMGCAVGMTAVAVVNMILMIALNGQFGGWWWLIFGVGMITSISKVDKEYAQFMASRGQRV